MRSTVTLRLANGGLLTIRELRPSGRACDDLEAAREVPPAAEPEEPSHELLREVLCRDGLQVELFLEPAERRTPQHAQMLQAIADSYLPGRPRSTR